MSNVGSFCQVFGVQSLLLFFSIISFKIKPLPSVLCLPEKVTTFTELQDMGPKLWHRLGPMPYFFLHEIQAKEIKNEQPHVGLSHFPCKPFILSIIHISQLLN